MNHKIHFGSKIKVILYLGNSSFALLRLPTNIKSLPHFFSKVFAYES